MPKSLRIAFTGLAFLAFFVSGGLVGRVLLPLLMAWPGSPARKQARREWFMLWAYRWFVGFMKLCGLIHFRRPPLPPDFPAGRPYVLVANHPSLIDVLLLLTMLPGLTSLVKSSWFRSWLIRPVLRHGGHIAGPEPRALGEADDAGPDSPVLDRMVAHLRAGHPLLVFPEGSRSHERGLRRFRRGAIEAALRAGVPIVPAFISVAPPMLMKHQPWHEVPPSGGRFTVEFFPVIETAGRQLDGRVLGRELKAMYERRHAQMLAERDALFPPPAPPALPPA